MFLSEQTYTDMQPSFTKKLGVVLHAPRPTACSFPLTICSNIPAAFCGLAAKGDTRKTTISRADVSCSSRATANPNVMQDEQSAGTEKKNVSQNGRAQNIHCDNVTPSAWETGGLFSLLRVRDAAPKLLAP